MFSSLFSKMETTLQRPRPASPVYDFLRPSISSLAGSRVNSIPGWNFDNLVQPNSIWNFNACFEQQTPLFDIDAAFGSLSFASPQRETRQAADRTPQAPAQQVPSYMSSYQMRGRGECSGTNVTNLREPISSWPLKYTGKRFLCSYCVKQDLKNARTHPLKVGDKVCCPILRELKCRFCGTPNKDEAHTSRFCPARRFA